MSIRQLLHLTPPPPNPVETAPRKGWKKFETRVGLQLPPDYKSLLDHYGTGTFSDVILLLNPFAETEYFNLLAAVDTYRQAERQTQLQGDSAWNVVHPFELYPAPDGLLPWGTTKDYIKVLFWHTSGLSETWETVFYNLKTGEYEVWKMTCTAFLAGLFTQTIQSVLLPEDFFQNSRPMTFQPPA